MADECLFCSARIDDETFADNGAYRAVYNVFPLRPGHSLVLPKRHVRSLLDMREAEISGLFLYAVGVARVLMSEFRAQSFDVILQEGEAAGQTVPHVHVHVIPRAFGDFANPKDWWPALERMQSLAPDERDRFRLSGDEMRKIVSALRRAATNAGLDR